MYNRLGEDFKFVATEPVHEERLKMGYHDMSELYPFTLNTYISNENHLEGVRLGTVSDVVIIGAAPDLYIKNRLNENKIIFRYSERIFKRGQWRVLNPRIAYSLYRDHTRYRNKKVYMLCASAYTADDFNLVGAYKKKTYKWAYFPEVKQYNIEGLISKKKNSIPKILWAGRFLDWKHTDHAILTANMLKKLGYKFTLDIIGTGELGNHLKDIINEYNLSDRVNLLGSMKPEDVRKHMELANIYLFTSDYNEGWGAVLNESMNSGCAVVASHAIGSVPFLMKNGLNGLIYKNGDIQDLFKCTKGLLDDSKLCEQLGREAYKTLENVWNANVAAERFLKLANGLLMDENISFQDGPCSKASVIRQHNMYYYSIKK